MQLCHCRLYSVWAAAAAAAPLPPPLGAAKCKCWYLRCTRPTLRRRLAFISGVARIAASCQPPDCFIIAAIISSLSLTPGDESAGDIKESGGEIITRRSIPAPLAGPPPRMDFQVEPCCNYLCKLKDISRRLSGCEGAYNFIRGRSSESAPAGRSRWP